MIGRIVDLSFGINRKQRLTLEIDGDARELYDQLHEEEKLSIEIKKYRQKRSLNANALLWKCIGDIAMDRRADKWDIYLMMLKRYGQYTYICIKPKSTLSETTKQAKQ